MNSEEMSIRDNEHCLCRLENVEKRFERSASPALGPLSTEIYAGEILGLRGSNGAGKSTLLSLVAGVMQPDKGVITYAKGVKGSVAYVPQELSLYESMTGNQNLNFYGIAQGLPFRALGVRRRWLLNEVGLTEKARTRVSAYSGGMKRRLHLISALMVTPRFLLLDEPTVGADTKSIEAILKMISHLRDQGCGIVLVTHSDSELTSVCDRIITLDHGRIVS